MRAGVASLVITSSAQVNSGVITSDDIKDLEIVNADIKADAGVLYSKLLSSAVDTDIVPDGHATRSLGSGAKNWNVGWIYQLVLTYMASHFVPSGNNNWNMGSAVLVWKTIYVNDIQGAARGNIMVFGLLG